MAEGDQCTSKRDDSRVPKTLCEQYSMIYDGVLTLLRLLSLSLLMLAFSSARRSIRIMTS